MSFKNVPLYGGAITVDLPSSYADTSQIRQVPDHQEVYLDADGYSGAIFEILEYVDKPTDGEALQYHFADLVDGTGDATNLLSQGSAQVKNLPTTPTHTLSFIQTPQPAPPGRKSPDFVAIHLLLLRLKEHGTDILITVNAPHYPGEYQYEEDETKEGEEQKQKVTRLMRDADAVREKVLESFQIREWGLFEG